MTSPSADERSRRALAALQAGSDHDYIGEPVSQLRHALQCGFLARQAGAPENEVLAALFHDIGHLVAPADAPQMDGLGVVRHEHVGAAWLAGLGFGASVYELVGAHVEAKRYLAHKNPRYHECLSGASKGTLAFQGGPMTPAEAARFEHDPRFAAKVRLRSWDEAAKDVDRDVPDLESYADLVRAHLEQPR